MSMSTPINNLPLKTQQSTDDSSDINDPLVQDVLNEFQEELVMSKKQENQSALSSFHQNMPQRPQMQLPPVPPSLPSPQTYQQQNKYTINYNNDKFPYSYLNMDIAKKTSIIVIIVILIFHTSIVEVIYEKMPIYLQETLHSFDIYVRAAGIFVILYALAFLEYI